MEWAAGWLICGIIAAAIGGGKGEGCAAFIFGILLGPFGILIALASSGDRTTCPFCAEKIKKKAKVCPHCQRDIPAK